jgi:ribosome-associated protein YbcJ (S4-like RNA binding protein)
MQENIMSQGFARNKQNVADGFFNIRENGKNEKRRRVVLLAGTSSKSARF